MSDSRSAGYYSEQQRKTQEEKCPKAKDKEHNWEKFGMWPSTWYTCKRCKQSSYSK